MPKQARPNLLQLCASSHEWFASLCVDSPTDNPLRRSLGWIGKRTARALTSKWTKGWLKKLTLETLRRSQTWAPPKISNSLFLWLGASLKVSQPIPHCHCQTHTHRHTGLESRWTVAGTSEPDQSTTPIESERDQGERTDDSNAAACHAFHTSSLLTIQSSWAPGGPRHWNPVVQSLLPTLGDWMAATHSSTFSTATGWGFF